jgi:hypothetical protein
MKKLLLGDFNTKVRKKNNFKPTNGNQCLHKDSNDNGVGIVNFATSKNLPKGNDVPTPKHSPGIFLMGRLTTRLITY